MARSLTTNSGKEKSSGRAEEQLRSAEHRNSASLPAGVFDLHHTIGNQTVGRLLKGSMSSQLAQANRVAKSAQVSPPSDDPQTVSHAELLTRAHSDFGRPLDETVRTPLERKLGVNLSDVRVHSGQSAEAAAESLGARAYTIGSNIYLGREAHQASGQEKKRVLAHEAVHTVQQGGRPVALQGKMRVSHSEDGAEIEADRIASAALGGGTRSSSSLAPRTAMRVTPVTPSIQRDITGSKKLTNGDFDIKFKKKNGAAKGDQAVEDGKITFMPDAAAPESDSIRFVQIARDFNVTTGAEVEWTGGEAARNKMRTTEDKAKGIEPGFFLDQIHASQKQRTKKSDPAVLPYYDVTSPGTIGKRKGKTVKAATLEDAPASAGARKFSFVTSAKASDTGTWYGTVLWGFETYLDKGVAKIKGEYHSFEEGHKATTDEALKKFDEYYKNPGASTAPTK
jgi:hypothetical protein